jgi:hypothetical protein
VVVDVQAVYPQNATYWTAAEANMPHLVAAGEIAVEEAYDLLTDDWAKENLHRLHYLTMPKADFSVEDYRLLFGRIDALVAAVSG